MEEAEALRAVKKFYRSNVNLKAVLYDDGKNFSEKATTLVLFGGTVAAAYRFTMGVNYSHNIVASLPRAAYSGMWGAVLGGTYITVVHLCATVRQSDSPTNHTFAGIATGFMLGVKARSQLVAWRAAPILGAVAYFLKDAQQGGFLDNARPLREHLTPPDRGRFFTPQGYRNAESTYDPEKTKFKAPVSDLISIYEERQK